MKVRSWLRKEFTHYGGKPDWFLIVFMSLMAVFVSFGMAMLALALLIQTLTHPIVMGLVFAGMFLVVRMFIGFWKWVLKKD